MHATEIVRENNNHGVHAKKRFFRVSMNPERKFFFFRLFTLLSGGLGLLATMAGCGASTHVRFEENGAAEMGSSNTARILSRAADRVSRDWDRLLAFQSHLPPAALGISRIQKTGMMGRRFTMKYVGPVQPFLKRLGKTVRWSVKVIGRLPESSPMIEIRAKREPLYDILRDAGVQVTPSAWIVIRPEGREIDLIYPPPLPSKRSETKGGLANEK